MTAPRPIGPENLAEHGSPVLVREDVWMLPIALVNAQPAYTICYVIRDSHGDLHVIDPGMESEGNWAFLEASLDSLGGAHRVASVVATHIHPDHLGMAKRLRDHSGAPIAISRRESEALDLLFGDGWPRITRREALLDEWGVPSAARASLDVPDIHVRSLSEVHADVSLDDGDVLDIPGRTMSVMATPGHTAGSVCIIDSDERLVFAGDTLTPRIFPGFGIGGPSTTNAFAEFLESLDKLAALDDHEACPGHEYRFAGIARRSRAIADHHVRRSTEVATVLATAGQDEAAHASTVWTVAQQLSWKSGFAALSGGRLRSALVQTSTLIDYISAGRAPSNS
jgi:glyoxylase-like metal-dependent hydrolase (beta-lactamase superfamily II)